MGVPLARLGRAGRDRRCLSAEHENRPAERYNSMLQNGELLNCASVLPGRPSLQVRGAKKCNAASGAAHSTHSSSGRSVGAARRLPAPHAEHGALYAFVYRKNAPTARKPAIIEPTEA